MTCDKCKFSEDRYECELRYFRIYGEPCGSPDSIVVTLNKHKEQWK